MNLKTRFLILPLSLSLLGLGCNPTPPTPPAPPTIPTPGSATVPTPPAPPTPVAAATGCVHPYLPLKTGYQVDYTSNVSNNSGYTMKVTGTAANESSLKYTAGNVTIDHVIRCANGELNEDAYLDLSRFFVANAPNVQMSAQRLDGPVLPANLHVGSQWSATFKGTGSSQAGNVNVSSDVEVKADKNAVGTESVTTPAGTFANALKVKVTYTIKTTVNIPTRMVLPPIVSNGTEWWVEGKGLVKSVATFGTQNVTTEAQSIVTP